MTDKLIARTSQENPNNKKPFLSLYETVTGYTYAERAGKDSVAFILVDRNSQRPYGLINEFKPPLDQFLHTAFGGSMDNEQVQPAIEYVRAEVLEEAGYRIPKSQTSDRITLGNPFFVSTQMNQHCFLYLVDVTGLKKKDKSTFWQDVESYTIDVGTNRVTSKPTDFEKYEKDGEKTEVVWMTKEEVLKTRCWKAQLIALKGE